MKRHYGDKGETFLGSLGSPTDKWLWFQASPPSLYKRTFSTAEQAEIKPGITIRLP